MRRLVSMIIVMSVIWCAWWIVASTVLERSVQAWVDDRNHVGWQVDVAKMSKQGFPFDLHTQLEDVFVSDPTSGVSVEASQLDLITEAYWPGFVTVVLPDTPVRIVSPAATLDLKTENAQAGLRLHPGVRLQLQSLSYHSDAWDVSLAGSSLFSADDLVMSVTQDISSSNTYQIDLNATRFVPGPDVRTTLLLPIDWPIAFETLTADLSVGFDKAWDKSALNIERPKPHSVAVHAIDIAWGQLRLAGTGDLSIDPTGVPTGTISIIVQNWRDVLDVAEASGALPSSQRTQAEIMASALANLGNNPDNLNLMLSFQDGQMSLGPIRLGPAPRLILR